MTISNCPPVLDEFVCGYSLKAGTIFTGWLGLGTDVLQLVISVVYFLTYGREIPDAQLLLVAAVGGSVVTGSVYGLLLYGAYKTRPSLLLPYLILAALSAISSVLGIILVGIYAALLHVLVSALPMLVAGLLTVGLLAYLWLVVFSYYRKLQKCPELEYRGSIETVLTAAGKGEDCLSHYRFLSHGNVM